MHAAQRLMVGDLDGYRRISREMIQVFRGSQHREAAFWVARTCSLADGAVDDPAQLIELAEQIPKHTKGSDDSLKSDQLALLTLGTACERSGDLVRAERLDREALSLRSDPLREAIAQARLAIALRRQGRGPEARACLREANRWESEHAKRTGSSRQEETTRPDSVDREDWLQLILTRREARTLLIDAGFPADSLAR